MYLVEQTEKIEHHDDDQITNWFIIKRCYPEIYSIFATLLGICCFKIKNQYNNFIQLHYPYFLVFVLP